MCIHPKIWRCWSIHTTQLMPGAKLWSPESPHLYDLQLQLLDARLGAVDSVQSYVGIRSVGKQQDEEGHWRMTLNGHWLLVCLILFWMRSSSTPKKNGKSLGLNQFHLIRCNSMPKDEWWNDRRPMIHNLIYPLVIKHGNGKSSIYPNDFPNKSSIL